MKSKSLYRFCNAVEFVMMFLGIIAVILFITGLIFESTLNASLLFYALLFFVAALILHAIWDIGMRLGRIEQSLSRFIIDKENDIH